jgi:Subtilase family/Malectin domain/Carboxypeptidase regulatory-like domain/Viral BACON domain
MRKPKPGRWSVATRTVVLAMVFSVVLAGASSLAWAALNGSAVGASADSGPLAKVEPKVLDQIAANGQTTFWAVLKQKANLNAANTIQNRTERGRFVYERLTSVAEESQSGLRGLLTKRGVTFQPFWIINAIRITAGQAVLEEVAAQPEVEKILASRTYALPDPIKGKAEPTVNTTEWNIDRINAPQVWSTFGDRGDGIVVANVDTGVQYDHPADVRQYRGNLGGGSFDHNYNWFDPSMVCGSPSLVPCDNNGHGTHTMGTMVGDDGDPGTNQIGVAPHARWIAAKGCETNSCSDFALLASGQFILAPTDLSGANPRPDLRPHIVNNSWGSGPGDPFYQATVDAWVASGIFPAFSNGNAGPGCDSAGSPGDFLNTYSAGAFDINNVIAGFSSRGPSFFGGETKPNIAAPGVNVRSSVPFNSYAAFSGTSMASPHVAATVALMWSAAPVLIGDLAATRTLLDNTAIDTNDPQCGGTADDNNVWGEGRLDAFAAVDQSPRGPQGTLSGTVTGGGNPIAGATVHAVGPADRTTMTDANGNYSFVLPIGTYDVTASAFGFVSETAPGVEVLEGQTTDQDFDLAQAPSHSVSGTVSDTDGNPLANATVEILGTPIPPATTDANGDYSFASVPEGTYDVRASQGRCFDAQTQQLVVDGNEDLDFALARRHDNFGYFCQVEPVDYIEANTVLPLTGDDASVQVNVPFAFTFYGQTYNIAHVSTNGFLNFLAPNATFSNSAIPSTFTPNGAIYPFWDDMFVDGAASVRTESLGAAPNRRFVIEWRNVHFFADNTRRVDFEVVLYENGQILTQYRNIAADGREQGNSATLGIENADGTDALQYSFNEATIESPEFAVRYRLPPSGFVEGHVTDANDDLALAGATIKAIQGGNVVRQTTTDGNGFYRVQLPVGDYTVEASKTNYETGSADVTIVEDQTVTQDFSLRTPRGEVTPTSLEFVVPAGQTRTKTLTLSNTGSLDMTWEIMEAGGGQVTTSSSAGLEKTPGFDANARTTEGLYVGGTKPGWSITAPGDVIRQWPTAPLSLAWGVGFTGNVWLSDVPSNNNNHEFTPLGVPTGRMWHAGWAGVWPGDMAYDPTRGLMCQVNVGGDNGIYCWDPDTGTVVDSITSGPWTGISQRGLAYRPDDDSFYIGGWNEGILYHVKGLSYPDKGAVINQCNTPDFNTSGLAWNPAFNIVWQATNSPTDTIYELNPNTCTVLTSLPHPTPGFNGAGLEMDEAGNLWMISQNAHNAYLVESGVPAFSDVPWLSENPTNGTLSPGGTQQIQVTVNTAGLAPGVYNAIIFIQTNSGRQPMLRVPVSLIVPAYQTLANSGNGPYTDSNGDPWVADQAYSAGSWGYCCGQTNVDRVTRPIGGTVDDKLYQDERRGSMEYRFDGLPNGIYELKLKFAELQNSRAGQRLFDVLAEGNLILPALDVSGEVGKLYALDKTFYLPVTDGTLNVRFVPRVGKKEPIINAIGVTHRPDR